ncbi:MAG: DUF87 domain-containing protein [Candidatus Thorarchaeota archaeon]|nr:DUF87 domain-containing protein [Candidatus Thorarchaeota archaeon]
MVQVRLYSERTLSLKLSVVTGSIGSGKTEKAKTIVRAALEQNYGALIFDPSTDYQGLLNVAPEGVVIDSSEFYQNPLEPSPGMTLSEWTPTFIQVFAQNFGLKDLSITILQKAIKQLIEKNRSDGIIPTMSELYEEVLKYTPRGRNEESSHVSVLTRIENILDSEIGRALNVRHGFSPVDFEDGLLCVQLKAIGIERVYEFVVGITVAKLFSYRTWAQKHGVLPEKNVLVVLEEAHLFLREKLVGTLKGTSVEALMFENKRYRKYFQKNINEDFSRVKERVSQYTRMALKSFIDRLLSEEEQHNRSLGEIYGDTTFKQDKSRMSRVGNSC